MRAAGFVALSLATATPAVAASVHVEPFGRTAGGVAVSRIVMTNDRGMRVAIIDRGATLTMMEVPDRRGRRRNVVLALPDVAAYERTQRRWGGIIGRYAGRIADARFVLDGRTHMLTPGRNGVTLHGGPDGYDSRMWHAEMRRDATSSQAIFRLVSPAGDQGFPGRLTLQVTYRLMDGTNELRIEYRATTTAETVFNPTNHMFLNLGGADSGTIDAHRLRLFADRYAESDARRIPTGQLVSVRGTPLDFRRWRAVAASRAATHPLLAASGGYDHAYVLRHGPASRPLPVAVVEDPQSGRRLAIDSTEPAVVFNGGNGFDGTETGAEGVAYARYAGLALETQHLPDAPNRSAFASTVLRPGQEFRSTTVYRFSTVPQRKM
ncbi:aldose epimerase family protein [Sphingomonas sp. VNH70]|uniref:aldose epimerase family protein n=1 Tax=Sphingomonas silueang TaxID=3156617 RepID=UPI0032B39ACD